MAKAETAGTKVKSRKATAEDMLGVGHGPTLAEASLHDGAKVESFRKQVEYGPKKFIKP